jgi:nucleotide-binding universal stress UspA family protein
VLEGSAASAIVACAEELGAGLVVVGTHGRTGLARLTLGSVAERVIRGAGCSVLAVRLARRG